MRSVQASRIPNDKISDFRVHIDRIGWVGEQLRLLREPFALLAPAKVAVQLMLRGQVPVGTWEHLQTAKKTAVRRQPAALFLEQVLDERSTFRQPFRTRVRQR